MSMIDVKKGKCERCGKPMIRKQFKRHGSTITYYICSDAKCVAKQMRKLKERRRMS